MSNGKGSSPRPFSVPKKEFDERWGKIDWNKGKGTYSQKNNTNTNYNSKSKSSNKIFIRKGQ